MNKSVFVALMAVGVGTRFCPYSRNSQPKQFLDVMGTGKSLLRSTYERFLPLCPAENIFVITHEEHATITKEQLPELSSDQILAEPMRKNTAPCIAYACHKINKINSEAIIVVSPTDHLILNEADFQQTISKVADQISTPEEKSAVRTAYAQVKNISVDYGIMEKANNVFVWPSNFAWSDLGSWASLHDLSPKDGNNNSVAADAMLYNMRNSIIKGEKGKLIVAHGLNGYLVGTFGNVVIVCEKDNEDLFRRFVNDLKNKSNGAEFL